MLGTKYMIILIRYGNVKLQKLLAIITLDKI